MWSVSKGGRVVVGAPGVSCGRAMHTWSKRHEAMHGSTSCGDAHPMQCSSAVLVLQTQYPVIHIRMIAT